MQLSAFGQLMAQPSAIVELMEDLGQALNVNPDILFLGGGNPAQIPAAQACFQKHLKAITQSEQQCKQLLGIYQSPKGSEALLASLEGYFQQRCGWPVTNANLAVVSGSQTAFFILLNLFAGQTAQQGVREIVLPLVPEYLGYQSQGLTPDLFRPVRPLLQLQGTHRFKYAIDFEQFKLDHHSGAVCVSRPTNPSGNLINDDDFNRLRDICRSGKVPLIVDLAYGQPFPGLVYEPCTPLWDDNTVAVMSLSKLGMPGTRTAVIVAAPEIIDLVVRANTIFSLANGNLGPALLDNLVRSGDLENLTDNVLVDFYRHRRDLLVSLIDRHLQPFPYRLHQPEGAFFLWLWFETLPISSAELYQRLKQRGVLVMAGEPFFFGLDQQWSHGRQCLRLTYCQEPEVLEAAIKIIAQELELLQL